MKIVVIKNVTLIILCAICMFSCKSVANAQKLTKDSTKVIENKKPTFSEKDIFNVNSPNTVQFIGKVLSKNDKLIDLCNESYKNVITIEVIQILNSGFSIINPIHKGEKLQVIFATPIDDKNKKSIINIGKSFKADALEKLCKNTTKTIYSITSYKTL